MLAGCGAGGSTTSATPRATLAHLTPSPTPPPPPPPPPPPKVTVTHTYTPDGARVTVAIFSGSVGYVLHNGSQDPGPAASGVRAGPSIGGRERQMLLAAFNGGFKLSAGAGGYMQEGHVIAPLRAGYASLVIQQNGAAHITVWPSGRSVAYSVRQNLPPLVENGKPASSAYTVSAWGATLGGGANVARSAVGEDARGDLIYVASMSAVPIDLAKALVRFGARIGMELDINPEWVQLDVASRPGGPLRAAVRGQIRPPDQYVSGWTRDFIAVVAR
jgi:hypothetical protein